MQAIVVHAFGGSEQLALGELPDPVPSGDEIVISVRATAVNFVDILTIAGIYQSKPELPFVPGKCPAGIVHAVGPDVVAFKTGDRVLALAEEGGYGELCVTSEPQCVRLPQSMSFTVAASMSSVFDTAWFALRERARMERGDTVLVLGATGGVGLALRGRYDPAAADDGLAARTQRPSTHGSARSHGPRPHRPYPGRGLNPRFRSRSNGPIGIPRRLSLSRLSSR